MTACGVVIVYLLILCVVTILVMVQFFRRKRIESVSSTEASVGLLEGQTIVGVVDTKKAMYFFIVPNGVDEKSYE